MIEAQEPVGLDAAVQDALTILERAMIAAAAKDGHALKTFCLVWATQKGADHYGGSLVKGDISPDVMEFLADIILDDAPEDSGLNPSARLQ